jgi:hypothetical protein
MIIVRRRVSNKANFGLVDLIKEPFRRYGRYLAGKAKDRAGAAMQEVIRNPSAANIKNAANLNAAASWAKQNPGKLGAYRAAPLAAAFIGGGMIAAGSKSFTRRRRTKNGKIVVEQVNRK